MSAPGAGSALPDGRAWTRTAALQGVVPPLITPLAAAGRVDRGALAALVEHVLAAGCSGLFVLGGCGEGAWLTGGQQAAVVRAAVAAVAGWAPVLAGVLLPGTAPAGEAARQVAAEGGGCAGGGYAPPLRRRLLRRRCGGPAPPYGGAAGGDRPAGAALQHPAGHRTGSSPGDREGRWRASREC